METQFYILLCLRTPQGFINYGQYFLGDDRKVAYTLFRSLKGNQDLSAPLHIDLMETVDEIPVKISTISCSLYELGENCKIIARENFKLKNLEDMP